MKVAISDWQGRISPVFDVAGNLLVADVQDGAVCDRQTLKLKAKGLQARADFLAQWGVEVLICGAISWPLELALSNAGVEVVPQTCGEVEDVLAAFVAGRLSQSAFLMPGCCGRRGRFRRRGRCGRQP